MPSPTLLFTSLSAKKALYQEVLADARRFHPDARLLGTDCNPSCPAASAIEEFILMPPLSEMDATSFNSFCTEKGVTHVIPTRDGELNFLSQAREILAESGIEVFLAPAQALAICLDKLLFSRRLSQLGIPVVSATTNLEETQGERIVVKERHGTGSAELGLDLNRETARDHAARLKDPIFQPYIRGREFSSEVWLDRNSSAKGVVLRWREQVVAGESHRTVTFHNRDWEDLVVRAAESLGLTGHVLGQVLVDKEGSPHFVEINPRLGGATPLSIACGLHSIEWFLRETAGEDLSSLSMFRAPAGKRLIRKDDAVRIEN
mgnify:CR=1 FL=1